MAFGVPPERRRQFSAVAATADAIVGPQMKKLDFLLAAMRDFRHAGTLWASSHAAAREIAKLIGPRRRFVVEYGAGDGAVTAELLNVMPADGRLLALEINAEFCDALSGMGDPRLIVRQRDIAEFVAARTRELPQVEAAVSGIPLSFLTADVRRAIVERTYDMLVPGGVFVVYQVSPVFFPAVKRAFPKAKLRLSPRNLPPYFICVAEK